MDQSSRKLAMVALLGAPLLFPACSGGTEQTELGSAASGEESTRTAASGARLVRAEFVVDGMTCGGCELGVRTILNRLDGVETTAASYEDSRAVVTFDPEKVDPESMIVAISELGYTARLVGGGDRP